MRLLNGLRAMSTSETTNINHDIKLIEDAIRDASLVSQSLVISSVDILTV